MTPPPPHPSSRLGVDASTLIALARIGQLSLLLEMTRGVHITSQVLAEVDVPDRPEAEAIQSVLKEGWISIHEVTGLKRPPANGLGKGEASLFDAASDVDLLVLDDLPREESLKCEACRAPDCLDFSSQAWPRKRSPKSAGYSSSTL
jgi:hypothetical protein